jgi:ATP-binding cassette, subfamily G (WHITE), eye pigment precursor transporter
MRWLLWRNVLNDMRTPIASKILFIQTLVIGLFFGLIYLQLANDENGAMDRNGCLFILLMNTGFAYLFPILNTFCGEMPIYYREYKNNMYSSFAYYISKQLAEVRKLTNCVLEYK